MAPSTIINFFLIIGAIQGFIFIGVTFFMRNRIERPVLFLNLFVLFLSLNNLQSWVLESKLIDDPLGTYLTIPWYIMIVPMFYSFFLHYLRIENRKKTLIWLSTVLFLSASLVRVWLVFGVKNGSIGIGVLKNYTLFEDCFVLCYSIWLYLLCIDVLRRHQRMFSEILSYDNLRWVRRFLRWGGIIFALWGLAVVLNIFSSTIKAPDSYYPLRLLSSILIYWVGYQGFFQFIVLKERMALRSLSKNRPITTEQRNIQKKGPTRNKIDFHQIDRHVEENKSYLNPQLGLETLASELGLGISTISKVINENGIGFSDYINAKRIKEVQRFITDPDFKDYTIVAIGLECGFNSRSTFYSAFKKEVGVSPLEYRRKGKG